MHRRYTKAQKASAVAAAVASSTLAASEASGIPRTTIAYWLESPEFGELRQKTREQIAQGSMVVAQMAQSELIRKLQAGEVEPRDLAVIFGIAIDKAQLLSGQATSRSENRTISDGLDDHEKQQLRDALDRLLGAPAQDDADGVALGAGAEVRQ